MRKSIRTGADAPKTERSALPAATPQSPATTLSGAFAAVLGAGKQKEHPFDGQKSGRKTALRQMAGKGGSKPLKDMPHGAPAAPRKGHR